MTGPEHYKRAERLLGYAEALAAEARGSAEDVSLLAEAQVYATLALAAATAVQPATYKGAGRAELQAWASACGTPEK
jgi:hypothetical protein